MWPTIITAGAGLLGKGLDLFNSQNAADTAFARQKELMALQQSYAVQNWNREVNYNNPKEQMKRLKDAGLNPNLVYGSGAAGLEAPSTAAPTAPSAPMQVTAAPSFGSLVSEAAQAGLAIAQAKKAGADTIGQTIENEFLTKTLQDRIQSVALQNKWTTEQTNKAKEEINNLSQQYGLLVAQQNILSTERQIRDKELANFDERFQKEMRKFDDEHKLSHEEYRRLYNTYDDFVRMFKANADKSEWDAKLQELSYNMENNFQEWERSAGLVGQFVGMLVRLFKFIK